MRRQHEKGRKEMQGKRDGRRAKEHEKTDICKLEKAAWWGHAESSVRNRAEISMRKPAESSARKHEESTRKQHEKARKEMEGQGDGRKARGA